MRSTEFKEGAQEVETGKDWGSESQKTGRNGGRFDQKHF